MSYKSAECVNGKHTDCAWYGVCGDLCACACHTGLSPELQSKYPTAHHAPLPDCPRCQGKGERWIEASGPFTAKWKPCMCIFVEHEHVKVVSEMFQDMIAREKARLQQKPSISLSVDLALPEDTIKIGDIIFHNIAKD